MTRPISWLLALPLVACDRIAQSALDLVPGDCFEVPESDEITDVQRTPCNEPHDGEVFHVADFPAQDTYPSAEAFGAWVETNCQGEVFTSYVGRAWDEATEIDINYFFPTAEGWDDGDKEMTCILVPIDGEPVSVSFRAAPAAS